MARPPPDPGPIDATSYHVHRAREGDRASLEWIVEHFTPLLLANARYRMGRTLRELYDPDDIVNDVWVVALPRLGELGTRDGRSTPVLVRFLSKTLVYRLNNLIEKHISGKPVRKRPDAPSHGESPDLLQGLPDETLGVVTKAMRAELRDQMTSAIDELSPDDREIVVLRGIEGRPYGEIAALLGGDPKVLAVRYQRALAKLRGRLPGSVFDELEG